MAALAVSPLYPPYPPYPSFQYPAVDTSVALHLLNRLTFGPRPGDIDHVRQVGIERWLDEQLSPSHLADPVQDSVRHRWAEAFESPETLYDEFPPPQVAQRQGRANDSMQIRQVQMAGRRMGGAVVLATLERHIESNRQLEEVMTDFWFNHFNVFIGKNQDRWLTGDYIEHAIRPHALGKFEDLLKAVAHHPAMLVYLDNFQSVAPGSSPPVPPGFRASLPNDIQRRLPQGINENYGRELLELHTLGVDGGYTQLDVQNVARILTGWSIVGPLARRPAFERGFGPNPNRRPFTFEFHDWAHDRGAKLVLGVMFPAGHMQDEGERLLTMLAEQPATARHIAHKLCERLVSDDAPDGCVDHAVAAWTRTHGNIAEVIRAIVASDDFWAASARRAKVKSPLEFLVSAMRTTGAVPDTTPRLAGVLQQLGQPLFQQQVPTGYPETMESWVNSGALLNRMNIAMAIAAGRLPGLQANLDSIIPAGPDKDALVARVNAIILGGQATPNTLRVIRQQIDDMNDPYNARTFAVGLALGSPEFQKQ